MKDGFIKIAAGVPEIALGDCAENAKRIIEMSREMYSQGVKLAVFTELGVTGYTLEDLFLQQALLDASAEALREIIAATSDMDMLIAVGVPVPVGCSLYNCAAVINRGKLLGLVPKTHMPTYSEFYEGRRFTPAPSEGQYINYLGQSVYLGQGLFR
ncbi:MAG: nitrilase-related carbon-nitrogen hydrolase, partial [Acutalibacteraceae bacterium]